MTVIPDAAATPGPPRLLNARAVVPGLVYRSAAPYDLDADAASATLRSLGVRVVTDLRSPDEARLVGWAGLAEADAEYIAAPLDAGTGDPSSALALRDAIDVGGFYLDLLRHQGAAVAAALEPVAQNRALLLHCSVGKDRTGVTAALVRELAGQPREHIVADYALTKQALPAIFEAMSRAYASLMGPGFGERVARENPPAILGAEPVSMEVFLDGLSAEFGGAAGFLRAAGWGASDVADARRHLGAASQA